VIRYNAQHMMKTVTLLKGTVTHFERIGWGWTVRRKNIAR